MSGGDDLEDSTELESEPIATSSDHQLMAELSDVPPAELLDGGGSEDMEMVGYSN